MTTNKFDFVKEHADHCKVCGNTNSEFEVVYPEGTEEICEGCIPFAGHAARTANDIEREISAMIND